MIKKQNYGVDIKLTGVTCEQDVYVRYVRNG